MKKTYLIGGGITLLTAAILTGCNSNDDDGGNRGSFGSTTMVSVTPSLGKILNAKVILRNAKTGSQLGSGNTGTSGIATFQTKTTTDPVIAEVQGQAGSTYFDESKKSEASFGAGQKIRVAMPALASNIGISTLTEVAYQLALKKAGNNETAITAALANAANEGIRKALAPELTSITSAPNLVGSTADLTTLQNNAASKYALKLAALAQLVSSSNAAPAIAALEALAADIVSDDKLDGVAAGSGISFTYNQGDLASQVTANLTQTITDANLTALNLNVSQFSPVTGTITVDTGSSGGIPAGTSAPLTAGSSATESDFFTAIAGNYKLYVSAIASGEGASTGAELEFPLNSLHDVTISTTGDVTIQGATKLLSYSHTLANGYSNNHIAYFANNTVAVDITYDPATGELKLGPQGFTATGEGGATLKSQSHAPSTGSADCGSLAALTLTDLAPFAKSYTVKILKDDPANLGQFLTVKSNVSLQVAANGVISLDGQTANVLAVCDNDNTVTNTQGVMVLLDKTSLFGAAHMDFFANGDTTGDDYTNTSTTVYQFFNNTN